MNNLPRTPVGPEDFRRGMRHVPTVVTVVTFDAQSGPMGLTIGSFVSLSLDPPLVCFNVQKDSSVHDVIVKADYFLVHVLREDQASISDQFADPDLSTLDSVDSSIMMEGPLGIPSLRSYLVRFECRTTQIYDGGDHSILLGCVEGIEEGEPGRPVVYHQRAYHAIGSHVANRPSP
jgi:3-hydroxy-9,10-secoandrosta-1,3,5(10)-triene-9,17-dione monooxygenase reductase component